MKGGGAARGNWEEATSGGLGMVAVTDALTTGSMVLCGGKGALSIATGCFRVLCVATYSCRPLLPSLRSSGLTGHARERLSVRCNCVAGACLL